MYIKGAKAEPSDKTRITPNKSIMIIIGASQIFFLIFKKSQKGEFETLVILNESLYF